MSLYEFRDHLFLEYQGLWFLWEPAWESFRPVTAVAWDGYTFTIEDKQYCADPSDDYYGYGTEAMKKVCDALGELVLGDTVQHFETPEIGPLKWFRDRFVSLSPCAVLDTASWKRMHRGNRRTCRKAPRGKKLTRRLRI